MNSEKLTQKTIETINNATAMARENDNQYVTPEHLLYALLDADGGLIPTLLGRMGADVDASSFTEGDGLFHDQRVGGVEAAGDVGRGNVRHDAFVQAAGIVAEALAHIAVQVDFCHSVFPFFNI